MNEHKNLAILISSFLCCISVFLLVGAAIRQDHLYGDYAHPDNMVELTRSTIEIESTVFTDEVALVTPAILHYMDEENTQSAHEVYGAFNGYQRRLNEGLPLKYAYSVKGLPADTWVISSVLALSEHEDFSNTREYPFEENSTELTVYHLNPGTQYYYRLTVTLSNDRTVGLTGDFITAKSPRFLTIDGITNVRDLGGWETQEGKTIQYGRVIRGTELDGAVEAGYCLTEKGLKDMTETFGIRYDMDLRSPEVNEAAPKDALGEQAGHQYYHFPEYEHVFKKDQEDTLRRVFSAFAKQENYPIYVHCTYGRDRTGMVCYLLEGLLGVSEEDAYKDYCLSAFTDSYIPDDRFAIFKTALDELEGDSFKEKVEGYLLSIGVTPEEINNIRTILLQSKPPVQPVVCSTPIRGDYWPTP